MAKDVAEVVWDLMYSITSYRAHEIDALRAYDANTEKSSVALDEENAVPPDAISVLELSKFTTSIPQQKSSLGELRNVADNTLADHTWCSSNTLVEIKTHLQKYIDSLQCLKEEAEKRHARKFQNKSFVEDKRYAAMRNREASLRVTSFSIAKMFLKLSLVDRRITEMTQKIQFFENVTELNLSRNKIESLTFLPHRVRVLFLNGNGLKIIERQALETAPSLILLAVSCNDLTSLDFLSGAVSLVSLDVSYNRVSHLQQDVIAHVRNHRSLTELNLTGNPIALHPSYRCTVLEACPNIQLLDEEVVSSGMAPLTSGVQLQQHAILTLKILKVQGYLSLMVPPPPPLSSDAPTDLFATSSLLVKSKSIVKTATGKGKMEDVSMVATSRMLMSLTASWLGDQVQINADDIELPNPMSSELLQASSINFKGGGKGGKGGPVVPEAVNPPQDELQLKVVVTVDPLNLSGTVCEGLLMPLVLVLETTSCDVGQEQSSAVLPRRVGHFVLDCSKALLQMPATSYVMVSPLVVAQGEILEAKMRLNKMKEHAVAMENQDALADKLLAEMLSKFGSASQTELQQATEVSTLGKGKAPAVKGTAKGAAPGSVVKIPDEIVAAQNESVKRKLELEEVQYAIRYESVKIDKFSNIKCELHAEISLNLPSPLVGETLSAPITGTPPIAKKRK